MNNARKTWRPKRAGLGFALALAAAGSLSACKRESPSASETLPAQADESAIDFPPEVQSDDPAVNRLVREVIETCAEGDYEKFRLLWTVREDPFPRREFERGWKALEKVRVLALDKYKTPEGEYLYSIHARVELDEAVPEPVREVVLLIVKENDQWCLKNAPPEHRRKVLGITEEEAADQTPPDDDAAPSTPPASPPTEP